MALKNLPAYTVDKIKVYRRYGEQSRLAGRDLGDRRRVMDVRLKREYNAQWTGRIEGGLGTHGRYSAGAFAMYFDDRQSFSLSAQGNNLGQDNEYGRWGTAGSYDNTGRHALKKIDLNYAFEPTDALRFSLGATYRHTDDDTDRFTATRLFLSGNDSYSRRRQWSHGSGDAFKTSARLEYRPGDAASLSFDYRFNLGRSERREHDRLANFDADPADLSLDSAWTRWQDVTSRQRTERAASAHTLSHHAEARADIAFRPDILTLTATLDYANSHNDQREFYVLEYPTVAQRRFSLAPTSNHSLNADLHAEYIYKYATLDRLDGYIKPYYTFNNALTSGRNPYYVDNNAADGLDPYAPYDLTQLALDLANSYTSDRRTTRHDFGLALRHVQQLRGRLWMELNATAAFSARESRAEQWRDGQHYDPSRRALFATPTLSVRWYVKSERSEREAFRIRFGYELKRAMPDPMQLVSVRDDRNPLFVSLGNAGLRNSLTHSMRLNINTDGDHWKYGTGIRYNLHHNALATARRYDRQTGTLTTQPVNVRGGQWSGSVYQNLIGPLPHGAYFVFYAEAAYARTADLAQADGTAPTVRYGVGNTTLSANASLVHNPSTHYAKLDLGWSTNLTSGARPDFNDVRTHELSAKFVFNVWKLPLSLNAKTDIDLRKPFGWGESDMNRARCLWNFSLSRSFYKRRLTARVELHDILNQGPQRTLTLNEYARTEQTVLTVGRYALLTLSYRFSCLPKKKGK